MRYFEGQPKVSQVGEKILDSLRKEATARKGSRNYDVLKTRKR